MERFLRVLPKWKWVESKIKEFDEKHKGDSVHQAWLSMKKVEESLKPKDEKEGPPKSIRP